MLCLTDLEPEVLALALEFVDDTSPHSTKAVACVNRYLNQLTRFISHRHKVIEIQGALDGDVLELINTWTNDEVILANIRHLTVKGRIDRTFSESEDEDESQDEDNEDEDDDQDDNRSDVLDDQTSQQMSDEATWEPLAILVSRIGRLRRFEWNIAYPMPLTIFDTFETHQKKSTLRIFNFSRTSTLLDRPEPIELLLAKSSALTHIRMASRMYNGDLNIDRICLSEMAFRAIVASAPNLEYAGFIRPHWGPLTNQQSAKVEHWKSVFYSHSNPNSSVKQLTLDGFEMTRRTLEDWATTINLGSLQNIKFSRGKLTPGYFQFAATALPNLKDLSLNLRSIRQCGDATTRDVISAAVNDYITSCSQLHTLSLWTWIEFLSLPDILKRHGGSLRVLQLHERETNNFQDRKLLSLENVKSIRASCSNLRSFTFDLLRHDQKLRLGTDDNLPYYEELAKFEHLDALQIYFDIGAAWLSGITSSWHMPPDSNLYVQHADSDTVTDNDTSNTNDQATTSSPSPPPRPAKRARTVQLVPPSDDTVMSHYVKHIWTTVFGHRAGARRLDVKFGDWEATAAYLDTEKTMHRHFVVGPHERDDVFEPTVVMHRRRR